MVTGLGEKQTVGFYLDTSIFHPQGGGQATDVGVVTLGGEKVTVTMVKTDKSSGLSLHECAETAFPSDKWIKGAHVDMEIDGAARVLNARVHSAGHLLDAAVRDCGFLLWKPAKGYHFADGPYVEYLLTQADKDEANKDEEAINTPFCPLQEKFHAFVLRGLINISEAP